MIPSEKNMENMGENKLRQEVGIGGVNGGRSRR